MTVPGYQRSQAPARQSRDGMAMTSLVLGLVGLPALLLCGSGLVMAMAGLVLGIVAAHRGGTRGLAIAGIAVCLVTLLVGALGLYWMLTKAARCADVDRYPTELDRQRCIEQEFPFARSQSSLEGR